MLADQPSFRPALGEPDPAILDAGAFRERIVTFVEHELPCWRDRPERPPVEDEPRLNDFLSVHLNSASRRTGFDAIQFSLEPPQSANRRGDIAVRPSGTIVVEGRAYCDFEQLLMIECKRMPTPPGNTRNDLEYVHGLSGHRTGGIERFKHRLHGQNDTHALIIGYVQAESFEHWLAAINSRLAKLAASGTDRDLWRPAEPLASVTTLQPQAVRRLASRHRRCVPPTTLAEIELLHLWLAMK